MTGDNILLDTNIVIELFKGNPSVVAFLETKKFVDIPFAVLGELYLGAYRSSNPKKHIKQVNDFLNRRFNYYKLLTFKFNPNSTRGLTAKRARAITKSAKSGLTLCFTI
ncbi:MAG: hypothetical protein WC220_09530 [Pedobacter sp.]|jgi:hypothetical protein